MKGNNMTGYNIAHGDTAAVKLDLDNNREAREQVIGRINHWVKWNGSAWIGVPRAADSLLALAQQLARKVETDRNSYAEIRDADLSTVDWISIVGDDLAERNIEAGRDDLAGLTHAVYRDGKPLTSRMSEDDCWTWIHLGSWGASADWLIEHEGYEIREVK